MVPSVHQSHEPKRHLDQFSRFCTDPKCYAEKCIVNGENPRNCTFPWDFVTPLEKDLATERGNTHSKICKDRACGSGDMLANRQTDTYTHTDVLIKILRHRYLGQSNK